MKQLLGWLAGGAAAAGVVGVAILATQDSEMPAPLAALEQSPAHQDIPAQVDAATETAAVQRADAGVVDAADEVAALPLPRLTDLRIEPDGMAVLAGTAGPQEVVAFRLDGQEVERTITGGDGRFAAVVFLGRASELRILSLQADPDGTPRDADETVLIAPTDGPVTPQDAGDDVDVAPVTDAPETMPASESESETLSEAETESEREAEDAPHPAQDMPAAAGEESATEAVVMAALGSPAEEQPVAHEEAIEAEAASVETDTVPSEEAEAEVEDSAPAVAPVLVTDETGVRLAQPAIAAGATAEVLSSVALDMIQYDAEGQVMLSGRASGATVRVYLDNAAKADATVGSGEWEATLGNVAPGVYTIRIDELDATGAVSSRIETPFLREAPEDVAAALQEDNSPTSGVMMKTVQPGHTLWAIARERYGDPLRYVEVFAANSDRIRDPDLIYPGQVFVLPEAAE